MDGLEEAQYSVQTLRMRANRKGAQKYLNPRPKYPDSDLPLQRMNVKSSYALEGSAAPFTRGRGRFNRCA